MNPDLDTLQPYPFERLRALKHGVAPPSDRSEIPLSIGEPKHPTPAFIAEAFRAASDGLNAYAATRGTASFRQCVAAWLSRRYGLEADAVDPERHVLPVSGTREGLFAIAQAVVDSDRAGLVAMPNPFYQIYEGATLLAGAEPLYLNITAASGGLPDLDAVTADQWARCQLVYLCSPGNPNGAVLPPDFLERLIALADHHDFIIASDECYSELYRDESRPPVGLLEVCRQLGRRDFHRCVVFHSLSKRSNVPGLRSGFVAGDAAVLEDFLLFRTYHGCAMPLHSQAASEAAWSDEAHVRENRALYREKFDAVGEVLAPVLAVDTPPAGFYLWPDINGDDETFARELYAAEGVTVLPGSYLSRETPAGNPGRGRVRIALVAERADCVEAAKRVRRFMG